jgi:hypothetical protein
MSRSIRPLLLLPILSFAGSLLPASAAAQTPKVTIDDLRTPASPGFAVLGVEPAVISKPTSPRGVALSLLSSDKNNDSLIPKNYALEVAPYWLNSHPRLTYEKYDKAGVADTLVQTLSVSFATATTPAAGKENETTGLGFGVRTLAWKGRHNSKIDELTTRIKNRQIDILRASTPAEEDALEADLRAAALEFQAENRKRVGWMLEMAGAFAAEYPDNDVRNGQLSRVGAWVTPSYQIENPRVSATGVARYFREQDQGKKRNTDANLIDTGFRLQGETEQLGFAFELVKRFAGDDADEEDSTRMMGLFDYRVNADIYLTASFGQDFADKTGRKPLVTFLGLNFGLSKKPVVELP